jgi:hypothetical protein
MPKEEMIERPHAPRGYSYEIFLCGAPECGPHIFLLDEDGEKISEMVLGQEGVNTLISILLDIKKDKGWKDQ